MAEEAADEALEAPDERADEALEATDDTAPPEADDESAATATATRAAMEVMNFIIGMDVMRKNVDGAGGPYIYLFRGGWRFPVCTNGAWPRVHSGIPSCILSLGAGAYIPPQ